MAELDTSGGGHKKGRGVKKSKKLTGIRVSNYKYIRDVILDKKRRTDTSFFEVILKPTRDANFRNTVNILDEMKIDAVSHYALVDISPDEYKVVQAMEQANGIR